jgi:hypothetical protein
MSLRQVRSMPARDWGEWGIYYARKAEQRKLTGG